MMKTLFPVTFWTVGFLSASVTGVVAQENWPQFRGETAGVIADNPSLPDSWGPQENVAWELDVPGRGWSSPIVWGDHIFVLTSTSVTGPDVPIQPVENYRARSLGGTMTAAFITDLDEPLRWVLYDVDFQTGEVRWEQTLHASVPSLPTHQKSTFASETPVTDGQRIYVYLADIGLHAVNFDGTLAWSVEMDWLPRREWGAASSPVLHDGVLYIVNDNEEESYVAAYEAESGSELWRTTRDEGSNWSTPFVWVNDVRTEIVTTGQNGVRSYGLNGELLWNLTGMSSLVIPTPFSDHGLLYINSGYVADQNRPVYAIRPGASGDITLAEGTNSNDYIVWSHPQLGSYNPSSLVYGDYHYTLLDRGILLCYDARTGREVYPRQRITAGTLFTASPWAYNGKIFALSEDGDTFVIQAGAEFEVLGKNSLDEMTLSTPAVARNSVIIRTATKLYRIAESGD
ncbi:MAG: serine/threonine protein kinase [Acidobacteria bacterium]|nr:serine/threonine protein kinase [Acidobacteriota bacterium]|tara:strand:+ start:399 stop:1769 length:1371 start_codon:yes stop_codon:yes gene_type:complete